MSGSIDNGAQCPIQTIRPSRRAVIEVHSDMSAIELFVAFRQAFTPISIDVGSPVTASPEEVTDEPEVEHVSNMRCPSCVWMRDGVCNYWGRVLSPKDDLDGTCGHFSDDRESIYATRGYGWEIKILRVHVADILVNEGPRSQKQLVAALETIPGFSNHFVSSAIRSLKIAGAVRIVDENVAKGRFVYRWVPIEVQPQAEAIVEPIEPSSTPMPMEIPVVKAEPRPPKGHVPCDAICKGCLMYFTGRCICDISAIGGPEPLCIFHSEDPNSLFDNLAKAFDRTYVRRVTMMFDILNVIGERNGANISDIHRNLKTCSRNEIAGCLKALFNRGFLTKMGTKTNTKYNLAGPEVVE